MNPFMSSRLISICAFLAFGIASCESTGTKMTNADMVNRAAERNLNFEKWMAERQPANCDSASVNTDDRNAMPRKRVPPTFPFMATKSGHCLMRFDVNTNGETLNIIPENCTDDVFLPEAIYSIAQWEFDPKMVQGTPVGYCAVTTKITFRLVDSDGEAIPE